MLGFRRRAIGIYPTGQRDPADSGVMHLLERPSAVPSSSLPREPDQLSGDHGVPVQDAPVLG